MTAAAAQRRVGLAQEYAHVWKKEKQAISWPGRTRQCFLLGGALEKGELGRRRTGNMPTQNMAATGIMGGGA